MFNARDAQALSQRALETPAVLFAVKSAILAAAEAAKFTTQVLFPKPARLAPGANGTGLSDCIRLLREQGQGAWAEAASQCNVSGYTVTLIREAGGTSQVAFSGLSLRWDSPRTAAAGAQLMSAEVAFQIAEKADQAARWAAPILEDVQRVAATGRKMHMVRDPLARQDLAWEQRLVYLKGLQFQVEAEAFGSRTQVTLLW